MTISFKTNNIPAYEQYTHAYEPSQTPNDLAFLKDRFALQCPIQETAKTTAEDSVEENQQNFLSKIDILRLSPESQKTAIEYPDNFLSLRDSLDKLILLSPESQATAILYPDNFLSLRDSLDKLLLLSPEGQKITIEYPDNFLLLKNNIDELLRISPEGQEIAIRYPRNFLLLKDNIDKLLQLAPEVQKIAIRNPQNFLRLKDSIDKLVQFSPKGQKSAISHPLAFLQLKNNIDKLLQLSPNIQNVAIWNTENFLRLKHNIDELLQVSSATQKEAIKCPEGFLILIDNIDKLLQLSPNIQKVAIWHAENFLLLKHNIDELLQLSSGTQKEAIECPEGFLRLKDNIDKLLQLSPEIQKSAIWHAENFSMFCKADAINVLIKFPESRIYDFLVNPLNVFPSDGELFTLIAPYIANAPNKAGATLLHKAARNGDLETFRKLYPLKEKSSEVILNRKFYFSKQTLKDCTSPSQILEVDKIPLTEFASPIRISQNYCNTRIRMANGKIRTFTNTAAKGVLNSIVLRSIKKEMFFTSLWKKIMGNAQDPALPNNKLTLYLNPGHSFIELNCTSCAENEAPFHESRGFYPSGLRNDKSGIEYSNENQLLKTDFYISDLQAKDAFLKIKAMEKDPKLNYKKETMNCVDGAAMIIEAIGESRPYDFFTDEQLSVHFDFFSNEKFKLPVMSEAPAVWYAHFKHRVSPLRASLTRTSLDFIALREYPNHQLEPSSYLTISTITILLGVLVYKVATCFWKKAPLTTQVLKQTDPVDDTVVTLPNDTPTSGIG